MLGEKPIEKLEITNAKEFVKAFYFVVEKFNKVGNPQNFHTLLYKLTNNLNQLFFKSSKTTPEQTKIGSDTFYILTGKNQHDVIKKEIENGERTPNKLPELFIEEFKIFTQMELENLLDIESSEDAFNEYIKLKPEKKKNFITNFDNIFEKLKIEV